MVLCICIFEDYSTTKEVIVWSAQEIQSVYKVSPAVLPNNIITY